MTWSEAIREFIQHLHLERGLSENTRMSYERDLKKVEVWLDGLVASPKDVTSEMLRTYIQQLAKNGAAATSQTRARSTLRVFYRWFNETIGILENPMEDIDAPRRPARLPVYLSEAEITKMFEAIERGAEGGERDYVMLELMYATGVRVSELIEVRLRDLDLNGGVMRVLGKGDKERLVPLHEEVILVLQRYIHEVRVHQQVDSKFSDHLLLNRYGRRLSRQSIFKRLKHLAQQAGIDKVIGPHTIRHTFATHLVQNGADIRVVQSLLGHESITSTEIYAHLENRQLEETLRRYHPQSRQS